MPVLNRQPTVSSTHLCLRPFWNLLWWLAKLVFLKDWAEMSKLCFCHVMFYVLCKRVSLPYSISCLHYATWTMPQSNLKCVECDFHQISDILKNMNILFMVHIKFKCRMAHAIHQLSHVCSFHFDHCCVAWGILKMADKSSSNSSKETLNGNHTFNWCINATGFIENSTLVVQDVKSVTI